MLSAIEQGKKLAGYRACDGLRDGMQIGLGTGSTAFYAIERVGQLVAEGMRIQAVATSRETERLARERNIPLLDINAVTRLDCVIDGVDEIDPHFHAIKGGGGALFREKIVANLGDEVIWVMDDRKTVEYLGAFPLPLEVLPYGARGVLARLEAMGLKPRLRCSRKNPLPDWEEPALGRQLDVLLNEDLYQHLWITDNGNLLVDLCTGEAIDGPDLDRQLQKIVGVVETGLFLNLCAKIYVGGVDGVEERINPNVGIQAI